MKLTSGYGQLVIAPKSLFSRLNQARLAQVRQVARYFRLGHSDDIHQIANTKLSAPQQAQQAQPRPIGQGPKHQVDAGGSFGFHIRLREYTIRLILRARCEADRSAESVCRRAANKKRYRTIELSLSQISSAPISGVAEVAIDRAVRELGNDRQTAFVMIATH